MAWSDPTGGRGYFDPSRGDWFPTPPRPTPAPPAVPGASAGGGIPAGLAGYPGLAEEIARINAAGGTNAALLTALRRRLLIQFGQIPPGLDSVLTGNANADVNQLTRDLAAQATQGGVSTVADLRRAWDQTRNQGIASLAEHGLARSGGTGQVVNESLGGYQRGLYGAQQSLIDQLGAGYQTFLGQQETLRQQSSQALKDALTGQTQGIANGTIAAPSAPKAGGGGSVNIGGGLMVPVGGGPRQALHIGGAQNAPSGYAQPTPPKPPAAPSLGLNRAQRYG